ncbi:hypothetical protein ACWC9T_32460 [Kitasatospora sp. NPDC001159]
MTHLISLPGSQADDEDQERRERQHAVNELLAEAGEAGRRAAGWVRELAERQPEAGHRTVLERAADAIERAAGREVVPGGDGQLAEELAYDLAAYVVTGSPYAERLPVGDTGPLEGGSTARRPSRRRRSARRRGRGRGGRRP